MLLGAIADDFTGASDLANTLSKEGMSTIQFVGIPHKPAPNQCEAGVVALKTRSIASGDAVTQSLAALTWLRLQGCKQILFKYCSTFDSTSAGNIGPVAEALLDALQAPVAVVCPAFPATGRRVFLGHLFVGDRLLSESGMEKHPLNPMTDANLRRWLRRQTKSDIGFVGFDTVQTGAAATKAALEAEAAAGRRLVVVDAISDDDLRIIGAAAADHALITGGSGIALGLPSNFRKSGLLTRHRAPEPKVKGRGVVLSGSCSEMSRLQVQAYLRTHPGLRIDPTELASGVMTSQKALEWLAAQGDANPIVYSTTAPEAVASVQQQFGRERIAASIEDFFGEIAARLADNGVRRIVVGGGETSGAVVTALGLDQFQIGGEIDPGVPALFTDRRGAFGLALKSGNFGGVDFFARALTRLEGA